MSQNLDKLTRKIALSIKNNNDYISIDSLSQKMNLKPSAIIAAIRNNPELFDAESELANPQVVRDGFYDFTTKIVRVKLSPNGQAFIANDKLSTRVAFRSIFVYPIMVKIEWAIIGFLVGLVTGNIDSIIKLIKKIIER
ncbi:hypothetical protein FO433_00615 [Weissella cibaria]|uniref:hypothetical protein n=1 Tax=Weissella cibaria TaxID=137591 RepID=UPI00118EAC5D|nr:hypothetical protein [Weissella cibaria]MCC6123112.1 hypothetical protein [Weissella cibaria]MCT0953857.1 hypothetical protein [Weissella cibaria]NFA02271.1 hypothetical protein [Weissella cibaria]TVV24407.1 hypothetical protein FO433_00615 [Weissella cibaria]